MKKRLFMLILSCCMLLSVLPIAANAAQKPVIEPRWTNTMGVTTSMSFDGTTGYVAVSVAGHSGVTNISGDIQLYYKNASGNWVEIPKDWDFSIDRVVFGTEVSFTGVPGREYKAVMTATVTKNGYDEPISKTATDVCPTSA